MRDGIGDRGLVKLIFVIGILVALAFVAISFGRPYYQYYTLSSYTHDMLEEELGNAQQIKKKVLADAVELNIPLTEDNIEAKQEGKSIKIKATWSVVVDFWGYYRKQLDFTMVEEY